MQGNEQGSNGASAPSTKLYSLAAHRADCRGDHGRDRRRVLADGPL
jgi:hypothetical protein